MHNGTTQSPAAREQVVTLELELQYRRLDKMLDRVEMAVEIGSWSEARSGFACFQTELETHMWLEEELMFPSLDAFNGPGFGQSAVMRAEHGQIRGFLGTLEGLLRDEQPIDEAGGGLETLLSAHNAKEERSLYPMFERYAPPETYETLDLALKRIIAGIADLA